MDDLGWGAIGPNGQAERRARGLPSVRTPHLDELAAEGVNFTRAYGATVCSPARSSQQIGFHQGHAFADRNDPDNAKKAMRAADVTMGDALSEAGYVTGYWGKWGYGGTKHPVDPEIVNVQTLPTSHGYRHVLAELHHVRAHTFFQPTLWNAPAEPGARGGLELVPNSLARWDDPERYPDGFTNHRHPDYPDPAYCDDAYCFAALEFVRSQAANYRETGTPFFGLLAVQIPHAPFDEIATLPGWDEAYRDDPHFESLAPQSRQWAAMVTRIDAHFGLLLDALEDPDGDGDPSDSVAGDTLVIFMSDNGGPRGKNHVEFDANGGLRGNKGSIHEGGIRVPTVMRWPSRITAESTSLRAGAECDEVIDVTDLLPTFCELAGVEAPVGLDGVSLAPLLTGQGERRSREFLVHEAGRSDSIIRGPHKLVLSGQKRSLFDLEDDPGETNDLAADEPDRVAELERLLLGERVTEPKGFANTYHEWTGEDGAAASDAANWSDYVYENEGVVHLADDGPPRLSWTAWMRNPGGGSQRVRGEADLSFLGLGIAGDPADGATQELALSPEATLTGRNEIRVGNGGILTLDDSTVRSLRWLDVRKGGTVRGSGTVDADVYQSGTMTVEAAGRSPGLRIVGGFRQGSIGNLRLALGAPGRTGLRILGEAFLAGKVELAWRGSRLPARGETFRLLEAERITGSFANGDDPLRTRGGIVFELHRGERSVDAVVVAVDGSPSS